MEQLAPLVLLGALGYTLLNLVKYVRARDWSAVATTLAAYAIGCVLVLVAGNAELTENLPVPGMETTFGDLDFWSSLILGASMLSVLGIAYDYKRAIDGSDSAATPSLLPGRTSHPSSG